MKDMIMKVTLDTKARSATRKYPYTGIGPNGAVVLFHDTDSGIALTQTDSSYVGEYSDFWDEAKFEVYQGVITLVND